MARFFTDKYLRSRAAMRGAPITGDAACEHCGYNLRGLRYGGACPECGTPIRWRRRPGLAFDEMPLPLIRGFRASCWLATAAIAGVAALLLSGAWLSGGRLGELLLAAILGTWLAGTWTLTRPLDHPQAVARGFGPGGVLRRGARWLQAGWVVALAASALGSLPPAAGLGAVFGYAAAAGAITGLAGLAVLTFFLGRLAEWVRDDFARRAFGVAVWGTLASGTVLLVVVTSGVTGGGLLGLLLILIVVPVVLALAISVLAFPVGLFSLSRSVDWSAVHARDRADRDRRLHERLAPRRVSSLPPQDDEIRLADEE